MSNIQEVFNNREVAFGIWAIIAIFYLVFAKSVHSPLKSILLILLSRRFVFLYFIIFSYFGLMIHFLYTIGFWDITLLKDSIFWILFFFLPLLAKTLENTEGHFFFKKILKENLQLILLVEFILNFWTFKLIIEILIVPISMIVGILYGISYKEKKYINVKKFLDKITFLFLAIILINILINFAKSPSDIVNLSVLKEFLLPFVFLILNLPIVYGLSLYNAYERVFIRVKGSVIEKKKIKKMIFKFSGFKLSKITDIHNHSSQTLAVSLTEADMKINLNKLETRLSMDIGDNYMKRTRFYITWCIIGMIGCIIALIISNPNTRLVDILNFNLVLDISRMREVVTNISSIGLMFFFCFLIYSIGLSKYKKNEISQVKKYVLYNLFYLIKRQYNMLEEFHSLDEPKEVFIQYVTIAYELNLECEKSSFLFENLLTKWENDSLNQLYQSTTSLILSVGIDASKIKQYKPHDFNMYYNEKKSSSMQNEKINLFEYNLKNSLEKYTEQIELCYGEFSQFM